MSTAEESPLGDLITLSRAGRLVGVNPATVWRWATTGSRYGNERVILRSYRMGRRILVDPTDLRRFARRAGAAGQRAVAARSR